MRDPPENLISPSEIRALLLQLGISQVKFAERIGVSLDTVRAWENDRRHPTGAARKVLQDLSAVVCENAV